MSVTITPFNQQVQDEGSNAIPRQVLNFVGAGVTVTDSGGKTTVTIAGGSGSGDVVGPASAVNERIAVFDGTTGKLIKQSTLAVADLQPVDGDLTAIAALSPANDDVIQRKSGAWTNRTMAQLRTDLDLGWQLIYDHTVSGGAVTSVATGAILDGDVDEVYKIQIDVITAAAGGSYDIQPNGDTGANYWYQFLLGSGAAASAGQLTTYTRIMSTAFATISGDICQGLVTLYAKTTAEPRIATSHGSRGTGSNSQVMLTNAGWNNTADNITSITFISNVASAIGNGSRFMIWKKSA